MTSTQLAGRAVHRPRAVQTAGGSAATCTLFGVHADDLAGDVDRKVTEVDEAAVPRERPAAEATSVVADDVQRAESVDKATDYMLTGGDDGSHPDEYTSQRRC